MPFRVIAGTFHVQSYSPDGDSIRFKPNDPTLLSELAGFPAKINARGHVQLRIEAIDSLETHYSAGAGGSLHQPLEQAHKATDGLLEHLGIRDVRWDSRHSMVLSAKDGTPGYILARSVEKNGRPVAFVYAGMDGVTDGAQFHLDTAKLKSSFNYLALAEGWAYPTYYKGLFHDLRAELTSAATSARKDKKGIHANDKTRPGFDAKTLKSITDDHAILPKLFRRLSDYMVSTGSAVGFKDVLALNREPVLDLETANFTHFDTFVEQKAGSSTVKLTKDPEHLVFDEMPIRPVNHFAMLLEGEIPPPAARPSLLLTVPPHLVPGSSACPLRLV